MTERASEDEPASKDAESENGGESEKGGEAAGPAQATRSQLGEAFLKTLLADWEKDGPLALAKMREEKPVDYVKLVAGIVPKEHGGVDGGAIGVTEIQRIVVRPQD